MNLSSFGFFEKLKLAPVYASKAQAKALPVELLSDLDKIDALQAATEKNPNEWVYWYAIAAVRHVSADDNGRKISAR